MAQFLTHHHQLFYTTTSNKTRLSPTPRNQIVYFYTKKFGKASKLHVVVCVWADVEEFTLRNLKFFRGFHVSQASVVPCVLSGSETELSMNLLLRNSN